VLRPLRVITGGTRTTVLSRFYLWHGHLRRSGILHSCHELTSGPSCKREREVIYRQSWHGEYYRQSCHGEIQSCHREMPNSQFRGSADAVGRHLHSRQTFAFASRSTVLVHADERA
jgi:hypothetical protein